MKRQRKKRVDRLAKVLPPAARFWTGISLIPGYFLVESLSLKFLLVILFAVMAKQAGKKIRYLYFIMMTLSITAFHILTPRGRILMELGPVQLTSGALHTGILKGVTLGGLVFLSLFSVTPSLKLPGRLGGLLARMFYYFEEILDGRKKIRAANFIGSLDETLMEIFPLDDLSSPRDLESEAAPAPSRYPFQIPYIILMEALVWGAALWPVLS